MIPIIGLFAEDIAARSWPIHPDGIIPIGSPACTIDFGRIRPFDDASHLVIDAIRGTQSSHAARMFIHMLAFAACAVQ